MSDDDKNNLLNEINKILGYETGNTIFNIPEKYAEIQNDPNVVVEFENALKKYELQTATKNVFNRLGPSQSGKKRDPRQQPPEEVVQQPPEVALAQQLQQPPPLQSEQQQQEQQEQQQKKQELQENINEMIKNIILPGRLRIDKLEIDIVPKPVTGGKSIRRHCQTRKQHKSRN